MSSSSQSSFDLFVVYLSNAGHRQPNAGRVSANNFPLPAPKALAYLDMVMTSIDVAQPCQPSVKESAMKKQPLTNNGPDMNTTVALYARVSSERQDVDLSVAAQFRALRNYAEKNGHIVVQE